MAEDIYAKQRLLLDPNKPEIRDRRIIVYGAGSGGSHITMGLCKLGFKNIQVIDFDTIEPTNLPAQCYPSHYFDPVAKSYEPYDYNKYKIYKVIRLKNLCKQMTGTDIEIRNEKLDEKSELEYANDTIHIMAFDSIEARKMVFNMLKGYPLHYIDGRTGGFNYEKYYLYMTNKEAIEDYEKTLEGTSSDLKCGEKCLWALNLADSSKTLADVIKLVTDRTPTFYFKSHLLSDINMVR